MFADGTWIPTPSLELTAAPASDRKAAVRIFCARSRSALTGGASLIPGQVDTAGQTFRTEDSFQPFCRASICSTVSRTTLWLCDRIKGRRSATVQLGARATPTGPVANFAPVLAENIWNYESA